MTPPKKKKGNRPNTPKNIADYFLKKLEDTTKVNLAYNCKHVSTSLEKNNLSSKFPFRFYVLLGCFEFMVTVQAAGVGCAGDLALFSS